MRTRSGGEQCRGLFMLMLEASSRHTFILFQLVLPREVNIFGDTWTQGGDVLSHSLLVLVVRRMISAFRIKIRQFHVWTKTPPCLSV